MFALPKLKWLFNTLHLLTNNNKKPWQITQINLTSK